MVARCLGHLRRRKPVGKHQEANCGGERVLYPRSCCLHRLAERDGDGLKFEGAPRRLGTSVRCRDFAARYSGFGATRNDLVGAGCSRRSTARSRRALPFGTAVGICRAVQVDELPPASRKGVAQTSAAVSGRDWARPVKARPSLPQHVLSPATRALQPTVRSRARRPRHRRRTSFDLPRARPPAARR